MTGQTGNVRAIDDIHYIHTPCPICKPNSIRCSRCAVITQRISINFEIPARVDMTLPIRLPPPRYSWQVLGKLGTSRKEIVQYSWANRYLLCRTASKPSAIMLLLGLEIQSESFAYERPAGVVESPVIISRCKYASCGILVTLLYSSTFAMAVMCRLGTCMVPRKCIICIPT